MTNRIDSPCWFRLADMPESAWHRGILRHWSTDHESRADGCVPVPVGVVESEYTGRCHSIHVERICFAASPPGKAKQGGAE